MAFHGNASVEQMGESAVLGYNWTLVVPRKILAWL